MFLIFSYFSISSQIANSEEFIDGQLTGNLGEILIRFVCESFNSGQDIRYAYNLMIVPFSLKKIKFIQF